MPKIDTDNDNFIEFRCTREGTDMLCHSGSRDAIAIGGCAMSQVLRGYFKIVDEAGVPRQEIFKILLPQLEETLNDLGAEVKIQREE